METNPPILILSLNYKRMFSMLELKPIITINSFPPLKKSLKDLTRMNSNNYMNYSSQSCTLSLRSGKNLITIPPHQDLLFLSEKSVMLSFLKLNLSLKEELFLNILTKKKLLWLVICFKPPLISVLNSKMLTLNIKPKLLKSKEAGNLPLMLYLLD